MSKHTPGPWKSDGDVVIATPRVAKPGGRYGYTLDGIGYNLIATMESVSFVENEANARLIAAAPDLLEAARAVLEVIYSDDFLSPSDIEPLRAAIRRAEGGEG